MLRRWLGVVLAGAHRVVLGGIAVCVCAFGAGGASASGSEKIIAVRSSAAGTSLVRVNLIKGPYRS